MNAVNADGTRGSGVGRNVVDEDRVLGRDAVSLEQNLEDARIGLDHADLARDDDVAEPVEERKSRALRRKRSSLA